MIVLLVVLLVCPAAPTGHAPPAAAAACPDVFSSAFRAQLADRFPGQRVTAAVHDLRSGCWYHLDRGASITTASVVKIEFLAGILLRAQDQGRGLTDWERSRAEPMIRYSHNAVASQLYSSLGGEPAMERLDPRLGAGATDHYPGAWGRTATTAEDQVWVALSTLWGGPLGAAGRRVAWDLMTSVHPTQQWGITAGVPAGWTVAQKNGFYPMSGPARWRIGSSGLVRNDGTGTGYAIAVLSDQNPDHPRGQALVETVSRRVASLLTTGAPASRAVDRSICVTSRSGESWSQLAARLGTGDANAVRIVSGGDPSPVTGMRACRPDLSTPYDPNSPNALYIDELYDTFLGRNPSSAVLEARTTSLDRGRSSRREQARSIVYSFEHLAGVVDDLYRQLLGRGADSSGRRTWSRNLQSGVPVTAVAAQLLSSTEFRNRFGPTDGAFVDALYLRVLGRAADPSGRAGWLAALDRGVSRSAVARGLYASSESRQHRVRALYRLVLARSADPAGLRSWTSALATTDDLAVAVDLTLSAEFAAKSRR